MEYTIADLTSVAAFSRLAAQMKQQGFADETIEYTLGKYSGLLIEESLNRIVEALLDGQSQGTAAVDEMTEEEIQERLALKGLSIESIQDQVAEEIVTEAEKELA